MNEQPRRFVLWVLMLAVSVLLIIQGRPIFYPREKVPFLPERSSVPGGMTIRLEGNCVKPGVYQFDRTVSLGTVINMTVPFLRGFSGGQGLTEKRLSTGNVVSVTCNDGEHVEITRKNVCAVERMVLGIPLDPNNLTPVEWELLPRIGPVLAKKIVLDRQENGDFRSICDLERVPGIGAATVRHLKGYFSAL
ncbi:MAG: competence protein ComEA [Deltaproteobacteria bacterium]|nr:competence protein ComEA [Deltaproteobacteria bacterium]TLN04552.1 MAG: competence protein ComEA [bacterium]